MRTALGQSLEGRSIEAFANFPAWDPAGPGGGEEATLLIGGTHGDERATVPILENFIRSRLQAGLVAGPTVVIPLLNPDGYARAIRYNARGVDINRNFPHNWSADSEEPSGQGPLSEPEARILHDFILSLRPAKIVSLHWALAEIDADGPHSAALARAMWHSLGPEAKAPYRLRVDEAPIQAGTPGSLGQWCGHGLRYPLTGNRPMMVTLELPFHPYAHPRPEILPEDHLATVHGHWERDAAEYLAGVESTVHRLLEAACLFAGRSRETSG